MTDLSGRVDTLENLTTQFVQDLLLRPDTDVYSSLLTVWNQQFNELSNTLTQMNTQLRVLQSLYTNLNRTVSLHQQSFTGVTGQIYPILYGLTGFSGTYGGYVNNLRTFSGDIYTLFTGHTGLLITGNPPLAHSG